MTKGELKINTRAIVLDILLAVEKEDRMTGLLIHDVLEQYAFLPARDRAFIKNLAEGTVERQITLDYIIDRYSKVKSGQMKSLIRCVLRMSVYQLYFMSQVPASAVCNEAVRLVRKRHFNNLTGFVNGVLRKIASEKTDLEKIDNLSVRFSMPEWIVKRFIDEAGEEKALEMLKSSVGTRPVFIRTNRTRISPEELKVLLEDEGVRCEPVEGIDYAFRISGFERLYDLKSFRDGYFSVQDISSMSVAELLEIKEGMKILDICAAPGGKSCHAAEILNGSGSVEARDISERKLEKIEENISRLALKNVELKVSDATCADENAFDSFDRVIADLPCSGLGVIGRKNDLKYRVKEEDIASLAELQRKILRNAVKYLKEGGIMVFSTCTVTKEEGTEQAEFIEKELGLKKLEERIFYQSPEGSDGFYAASFIK